MADSSPRRGTPSSQPYSAQRTYSQPSRPPPPRSPYSSSFEHRSSPSDSRYDSHDYRYSDGFDFAQDEHPRKRRRAENRASEDYPRSYRRDDSYASYQRYEPAAFEDRRYYTESAHYQHRDDSYSSYREPDASFELRQEYAAPDNYRSGDRYPYDSRQRPHPREFTLPHQLEPPMEPSDPVKEKMEEERKLYLSLMPPRPQPVERSPAADDESAVASEPPVEPYRPAPTADYLATTLEPSQHVDSPVDRKLLILDLNGTLLFRDKAARGHPRARLRPRRAFARPYFDAFKQYILHPDTNIDVMVWSSAQPPNVADMVWKSFGPAHEQLVATWDRTYFDLTAADYNKKSVTLKDLDKPWTFLALKNGDDAEASVHSAKTTLLLDDSVVKAQLQPYNHICVTEYDEEKMKQERPVVVSPPSLPKKEKKRHRKRKHALDEPEDTQRDGVENDLPVESSDRPQESEDAQLSAGDDMLLAVVGVLEHIRYESNVAYWIQHGGLWAGYDPLSARVGDAEAEAIQDPAAPPTSDDADARPDSPTHDIAGNSHDDASPDVPRSPPGNDAAVDPVQPASEQTEQPMWFEHPAVYAHWTAAGRDALKRIDIAPSRGRPSEPLGE